mgnify:CR=1 FL=1
MTEKEIKQHIEDGGFMAFTTNVGTTLLSKKEMIVLTGDEEKEFWEEHQTDIEDYT